MATFRIIEGDALAGLRALQDKSAQTCVTSPPYFGLRAYGTNPQIWSGEPGCAHEWGGEMKRTAAPRRMLPHGDGRPAETDAYAQGRVLIPEPRIESQGAWCQLCGAWRGELGHEPTPELYIEHLVGVFREVRRVLRDDGTLWINIGDSFCSTDKWGGGKSGNTGKHTVNGEDVPSWAVRARKPKMEGVKPKDLIGVPWMLAFALRADGWYLRQEIIWHKPNPMPESVTDRPTRAHEQIFLLSKRPTYYYDHEAIKEPAVGDPDAPRNRWDTKDYVVPGQKPQKRTSRKSDASGLNGRNVQAANSEAERRDVVGGSFNNNPRLRQTDGRRNKRSVWTVATRAYPNAHFATFNPELITPCILAGSKEGDTVLDPFTGSGTTGLVALRHNRNFIGCELNPSYVQMARERILKDAPMFNREEAAA